MAAHRQGIQTVLFPADNLYDLEEIPETVRENVRMIAVKNVEDVLSKVLLDAPEGANIYVD